MSIIQIDGFKAYQNLDGTRMIIINSDNIDGCMDYYYKNNIEGVAITNYHGYNLKEVDFLSRYPDIKSLTISESVENIEAIHSLTGLEELIISEKKQKIDFQYFPNLKKLTLDWSTGLINLDKCKSLESLAIYSGFNPKTKDLTAISNVHWLKKLEINSSSITSFKGSENFDNLEELEFNYCPKLENISGFEKSKEKLKSLIFGNCKSIKNYDSVVIFDNLNILGFNFSGVIKSIGFIKKMKSLSSFRFVGTDVVDGDITPCVGLKFISFTNKKHFTHKMEQLRNNLTP
jgi:protein phosphatase 1 regulatory subunit 7